LWQHNNLFCFCHYIPINEDCIHDKNIVPLHSNQLIETMNYRNSLLLLFALTANLAWSNNTNPPTNPPKDTLKVVDIEEVTIYASPKENRKLRQQPLSVSLLSQRDMQTNRINSLKGLSYLVPNLFIPDYGSKLTSSIYIRGIGSRINSSAIGVYVDNVPMYDKSAFDFDYADIDRIDVLRGPQGTLFGRNSMGGLINIHTKSPFNYSGTDLMLSAASHNSYRTSLTHYHRISNQFAFSAGGFFDHEGGFFTNNYNGKKIDRGNSAGGRMHALYLPCDNWKLDLNVNYEYSDLGGYPYGAYNKTTNTYTQPNYNFKSGYYRNLLNVGLTSIYTAKNFVLTEVTAYQHLRDRMALDQDFSPADMYTMLQKQKQNTLSEEISFKSKEGKRWQWTTGASFFYQWLTNNAPINFGKDFISMMQSMMDAAMKNSPAKVTLTDNGMEIPGIFKMPTYGFAFFHQSTYNNIFNIDGLSATVGLRLDYEKMKINYDTSAKMNYTLSMMGRTSSNSYAVRYFGNQNNDYTQLLPKFALKYDLNKNSNIYAQVSRGYRSGGYNVQMLSDYLENALQKNAGDVENDATINAAMRYKPEYSWNYETGTHLTMFGGVLWTDLSAFYMNTRNQQVARFADSGLGRYTANAGKSRSYGMELSTRANITNKWSVDLNYGYTYATFTKYDSNTKTGTAVDYSGKYIPFAPKHTLNVGTQYVFHFNESSVIKDLTLHADYSGAGRIYFTEANDVSQKFYGLLNARLSARFGKALQLDVWGRNILDKDYAVFYFDSGSNGFMQKGNPVQCGVDLRLRF
jgi:outer membrane receptor protein involved in Fe transport